MPWIRRNLFAVIFLAAILASFVFAYSDNKANDADQSRATVAACRFESARTAVEVNGWHQLAIRKRDADRKNKTDAGATYQAIADGLLSQIPAPRGHYGDPRLARATAIKSHGKVKYTLTDEARRLEAAGCQYNFG